ncbi:MAG TPA: hypothetical protein PLY87_14130 [Planctomycetaceae bacterium]|nr:hypothetical protein [Planctomycetaceae bacterium]
MGWETLILSLLGPLLAKCFNQVSSETPAEYLRPHYDEATGKMDPDIVREAIPATRRAVLKARRQSSREDRKTIPRYSKNDLYLLAETKLIEAMNAPPEAVAAAYAAAKELSEED